MIGHETLRVRIQPGSGTVVHHRGGVVVLGGEVGAVAAAVAALDADLTPGHLLERLGTLDGVDVAAMVPTPRGFRLLSRGAARAETIDDGLEAAADPTAVAGGGSRDVPTGVVRVWLGVAGPEREGPAAHHDLRDGSVPGSGAFVERVPAPTEVVAAAVPPTLVPSAPTDDPGPEPFQVVDLGAGADRRAPLAVASVPGVVDQPDPGADDAVVQGITCSRGHFNNPAAAYCQVCGISMVHLTHRLVPGRRPTLGFVVFDSGATFALDRSYVLGRQPSVEAHEALVVPDDEHSVSRDHARLRLRGWDVFVEDLGSTNGTFIWRATSGVWERLAPGSVEQVVPGTTCAIGRRTFVFEAVARSV